MKTTIDIKSAMLGLVAGVLVAVAIGAGTPSSETGRYQVSAGADACAVIVDTRTGRAWAFQPNNTAQWRTDANFWNEKSQ